jgi:hypothetical protein
MDKEPWPMRAFPKLTRGIKVSSDFAPGLQIFMRRCNRKH